MNIKTDIIKPDRILKTAAVLLFFAIIVRWWVYVNHYSVNLFFWDQWDFFDAFFGKHIAWDLLSWQHGPHRQGLGLILTRLIGQSSGWDTRIECFSIGSFTFLAMCLAFLLKKRVTGSLSWPDVSLALIFLTPVQSEIFAMTPNISHSAMPLLLVISYALSWTISRTYLRYAAVLLVNLMLTFTGFGVVISAITPLLFIIDMAASKINGAKNGFHAALGAFLISIVSTALYFIGYKFDPAVPGFVFPATDFWTRYPRFILCLLADFFQFKAGYCASTLWTGFFILSILVGICLWHAGRLLRTVYKNGQNASCVWLSRSIVIFSAYTLLFSVFAAIGRSKQGPFISRYIPYLIPGFFAIYLHAVYICNNARWAKHRTALMAMLTVLFFVGSFPLNQWDSYAFEKYRNGKLLWKEYYLKYGDINLADKASGFNIYPDAEKTRLKDKLEYLKKNRYNLYK